MKRILFVALLVSAAVNANAADVGVSISIGQPGFYGQIDIGNTPRPVLINPQPVVIERGGMEAPPIYLRVTPRQHKHWKKYCHRYHACNRRVYFVQDKWYREVYAPHYREKHYHRKNIRKHRQERRERYEDRRDDHRDDRREERERHRY